MATYNVRCYYNTGFNAVNIPSSPDVLKQFTPHTFPALEVLQDLGLSEIRIKATWKQAQEIDYICLYTPTEIEGQVEKAVYYIVTGIPEMVATDVAKLPVVCDYYNTAGGINYIDILDGITSRVTVSKDIPKTGWNPTSSEDYLYGEDPLLAPSGPLNLVTSWERVYSTDYHSYIETTLDLVQTDLTNIGKVYYESEAEGETLGQTVTPRVNVSELTTTLVDNKLSSTTGTYINPETRIYQVDDEYTGWQGDPDATARASIGAGIATARSLRVEDAVLNKVIIPVDAVETTKTYQNWSRTYKDGTSKRRTDQQITYMKGVAKKVALTPNSNLADYSDYGITIHNNRLLYGSYTPIGMMTTAGNKVELNMEQVSVGNGTINIRSYTDPSLGGCPYYMFERADMTPRTTTGDDEVGMFSQAVAGLTWKQAPLKFSETRGSLLNAIELRNSRMMADTSAANFVRGNDYAQSVNALNTLFSSVNSVTSMNSGAMNAINNGGLSVLGMNQGVAGAIGGNAHGLVGSMTQGFVNDVGLEVQRQNAEASYLAAKGAELTQYAVTQNVFVPEIKFPYNSTFFRDLFGEGILLYRYKYSKADVKRIDKLLTMYGYKVTKQLEKKDFSSRKYFNYIECSSLSVQARGNYNTIAVSDGISKQLQVGTRLWHVKPDSSHYTNNPIV